MEDTLDWPERRRSPELRLLTLLRLLLTNAPLADIRSTTFQRAPSFTILGIEANATKRAVRGQSKATKADAVYRAARRGDSSHMRSRVDDVLTEFAEGAIRAEPGRSKLLRTRKEVMDGWRALSNILAGEGRRELVADMQRFIHQMEPARTEKEQLVVELLERAREERLKDKSLAR